MYVAIDTVYHSTLIYEILDITIILMVCFYLSVVLIVIVIVDEQ